MDRWTDGVVCNIVFLKKCEDIMNIQTNGILKDISDVFQNSF